MRAARGQLLRCPHCLASLPRETLWWRCAEACRSRPNDGRVAPAAGREGDRDGRHCPASGCPHVLTALVPESCEVSLLADAVRPDLQVRHIVFTDPHNRYDLLAALLFSHFDALRRSTPTDVGSLGPYGGSGWRLFSRRTRELRRAPWSRESGPAGVALRRGAALQRLWLFHLWAWPDGRDDMPRTACDLIGNQQAPMRLRQADEVVVPLAGEVLLDGAGHPTVAALSALDLGRDGPQLWLCLDDLGTLPRLEFGLDIGAPPAAGAPPEAWHREVSRCVSGATCDALRGGGYLEPTRLPAVEVSGLWPRLDTASRHAGLADWAEGQWRQT